LGFTLSTSTFSFCARSPVCTSLVAAFLGSINFTVTFSVQGLPALVSIVLPSTEILFFLSLRIPFSSPVDAEFALVVKPPLGNVAAFLGALAWSLLFVFLARWFHSF